VADGTDALGRDKDLLLEKIGTNLNTPKHAKPRKEFYTRGGVAPPDKARERSSDAAMHAELVESREVQPTITLSAVSEGAVIRGGGELDLLDKGTKLTELARGGGGEMRSEGQIGPN
jgi:hypothetical protein